MSDSIPTQWISQYIINVAETFGKSFTEIPIDDITPAKKKRVQIIEFLTYNEDSAIWGRVSDKESVIPVCFTKAAVKQYMKVLQGRRLTEAKNAIFHIGQLRPTFTPIPVGNNRPKLTEEPHIALEAGVVVYIGPGLGVYGSPHDVESHTKVRAWVRGLRRGGDGGDVLKCRKQHTKDIANSPPIHESHPVTNCSDALPKPQIQQSERGSCDIVPEPPVRIPDPIREYRKRWIHVEKNRWTYMKPYIDDKVQDEQPQWGQLPVQESRDINIDPKPQPCTPPRTHTPEQGIAKQTTPRVSEWSPSERGSPLGVLPYIHPDNRTTPPPSADKNLILSEPFTPPATSPLQPPTPAQRVRHSSPHSPSIIHQPSSSFSVHIRKDIVRRVPHPGLPPSPTDGSGPAQILVPNSDISGTQSQSQPRSQSLPESQLHRPASPSQLTQEFKPGKTSTPAAVKQGRAASEMPPGGHPESHLVVDRASSTGFPPSDIHEGLSHNDHQLSDTSPDARQTMELSVAEIPDASIDAVNEAHIVAEASGEQSNGLKHITTPSPTPLHSPTHSLFSCPSASQSQVIPNIMPRETSPNLAEPIASTSRNLLHDAEGWKEPSFMNARKGKCRETEPDEKRHETHKRKRLSSRLSSPFTQKRRKIVDEKVTEPHKAAEPTPPISSKKADRINAASDPRRKESLSFEQLSLARGSKDLDQPQSSSPGAQQLGQKKRRTRLLGYEVDFNHPPAGQIPNTWMNMRQIRTILLRTGRIRTLGDEVTRDKRIYTKSE